MNVSDVAVDKLSRSEVSGASRLLARAFADDPIITHYLYGSLRRRLAFPAFFAAVLEEMLPSGHVYTARSGETLVGVAAWTPPDAVEPDASARAAAARQQRLVRLLFPRASRTLYQGFAALEAFHPTGPPLVSGVRGHRACIAGSGYWSDAPAASAGAGRRSETPCYLEMPFPCTHAFYERPGFERYAEHCPFIGAPQGAGSFLRKPDQP